MLTLHGIAIPSTPFSIILIEQPTNDLDRRLFRIEGFDGENTVTFIYGDFDHCNHQFTWIRDQIRAEGIYVREVGKSSYHTPRHMLVNCNVETVTFLIVDNLTRHPRIKAEQKWMARKMAAYNKENNGAAHEKQTHY